MSADSSHHKFMSLALEIAQKGCGTVSPNPIVGCVIVKNNHIIGQGFHQYAGKAHAEILALEEAGIEAKDADVYITLEPCNHYGKTPPSTHKLIEAEVKRVFVACLDVNPLVAGNGIKELEAAGIEVSIGLCEKEAKHLNEIFFHYIAHNKPFVIAKWAMSLDGKTITHKEDNAQISGAESKQHLHNIRQQIDAILIGANTARQDDPLLTSRSNDNESITKQPVRIILASKTPLPLGLKIFDKKLPGKTILATTNSMDKNFIKELSDREIEVLILPQNDAGYVDLPSLLDALGKKEITRVLVEGGRTIHDSFFAEDLVNKVQIYLAPVIISSLRKKQTISNVEFLQLGKDLYLKGDAHV